MYPDETDLNLIARVRRLTPELNRHLLCFLDNMGTEEFIRLTNEELEAKLARWRAFIALVNPREDHKPSKKEWQMADTLDRVAGLPPSYFEKMMKQLRATHEIRLASVYRYRAEMRAKRQAKKAGVGTAKPKCETAPSAQPQREAA